MAPQSSLRRWARWQGMLAVGALVALSGCSVEPAPAKERGASARSALEKGWETTTLAWGKGDGQVGLRPAVTERHAEGPSAVAVGPSGEVLVLDRLNERILEIKNDGSVKKRAAIASDAEHLAIGPDGATAAWSPLRATVWIAARDGSALGEVNVPRELRDVLRIELGISRRVIATTSMQETLQLGSPRAPLDFASALRTKREGAAFLLDGRAVTAIVENGVGQIIVHRKPGKDIDSKPPVAWTFPIDEASAVRIVGTAGSAICARIERVTQDQDDALAVEREALCVEADSGHVLLQRPLGRPGLYTVRDEISLGGSPAVLAFITPEEGGLRVDRVALSANGMEVAQ